MKSYKIKLVEMITSFKRCPTNTKVRKMNIMSCILSTLHFSRLRVLTWRFKWRYPARSLKLCASHMNWEILKRNKQDFNMMIRGVISKKIIRSSNFKYKSILWPRNFIIIKRHIHQQSRKRMAIRRLFKIWMPK